MAVLLKLDAVQSPLKEVRLRRKALARRLNVLHDRVDSLPRPSATPTPAPASPTPVTPAHPTPVIPSSPPQPAQPQWK